MDEQLVWVRVISMAGILEFAFQGGYFFVPPDYLDHYLVWTFYDLLPWNLRKPEGSRKQI